MQCDQDMKIYLTKYSGTLTCISKNAILCKMKPVESEYVQNITKRVKASQPLLTKVGWPLLFFFFAIVCPVKFFASAKYRATTLTG